MKKESAADSAHENVTAPDQDGTGRASSDTNWREYERVPADGQACLLDQTGVIVWTNASWQRNGSPLPFELAVGDNYRAACHVNRASIVNAQMLDTALENLLDSATESFDIEIACVFPERSKQPGSANRHCLFRGQAIVVDRDRCAMVFHEDVTESKLANAQLHASEERHRKFFEAAPDAVFLLSGAPEDAGRILDANAKAAETHGYSHAELLTMSIGDIDVHEDAALVKQRITSLFEHGSLRFEVTHKHRDGTEFPVEVSAQTATIDGKPCIVSFNRDISERYKFEDAIRENQMRIDLAARASKVGFWHWDLHDDSVRLSPEWKAQIGYEPHEIEDKFEEWSSRVHPDDFDSAMQVVTANMKGQATEYTTEFRFQHKDGSYRWIFVRAAIHRNEQGEAMRLVGCHVDITSNKQLEAEREQLSQRLNQLQRIEAMGTLAGGIAHDFNNILTIITGNVELALMLTEVPELRDALTEIFKASDRAGSLVRQILSFSREEAPERKHVDLEPIVEEALRLLRATNPQRIRIESHIEIEGATAFADSEQLHQVLVNLGTNACHAIGEGHGRVVVRLTSGPIPERLRANPALQAGVPHAILEIADDGEGMDQELQSRIFDPFFTTKATGKGTGLGLSVVHGIVTAHDGALDVQSEPGVGTTFRIYLPPSSSGDAPHALAPPAPMGNGRHVLLVDDEPGLLQVLKQGLEHFGFEVTAIRDPQQAIETARSDPAQFDALVTDFDMPEMNGIEATRTIRSSAPGLPVILCSGFMDTKSSTDASEAGIQRLIAKPIRVVELAQAVCEVLNSTTGQNT